VERLLAAPPVPRYQSELKRAGIGYKELAERLNKHGLQETETTITGKLARGTDGFASTHSADLDRDAT
jgi:hypothetical protein